MLHIQNKFKMNHQILIQEPVYNYQISHKNFQIFKIRLTNSKKIIL